MAVKCLEMTLPKVKGKTKKRKLNFSQKDSKSCSVSYDSGASWILPGSLSPVFPPGTAHCWMATDFLGYDGETWQHMWSSFRRRKCDSHQCPQTLSRIWPSLVPLLFFSFFTKAPRPQPCLPQTWHEERSCVHGQLTAGRPAACTKIQACFIF